jgi:dihydroorotate dehydrogenase (NAD+) catalytic subunit
MINFGEGKKFSTIVISTACGYDGRGIFPYTMMREYGDMIRAANATGTTRFSKSMTRHKRSGNFHLWRPWTWRYIQDLGEDGMLNAYGLTNKGEKKYTQEILNALSDGIQIVPNFFPQFERGKEQAREDVFDMIHYYLWGLGEKKFWALELNFSCPNTKECIADNVENAVWLVDRVKKYYPELIVIAKISVVHPIGFAVQLRDAGADVLHAVNTIPFNLLFPDRPSPLDDVGGGGVSGGPAFEKAFAYNAIISDYFGGPIIWGCGIIDNEKLNRCLKFLENKRPDRNWSVSICSAALRRPIWLKEVIEKHNRGG